MTVVFCHGMSRLSKALPEKTMFESQPERNQKEGKGTTRENISQGKHSGLQGR